MTNHTPAKWEEREGLEEMPNNTKDLVDMTVIYPEIGDVLRESHYEFRTGDKIRKLGLAVESLLSSYKSRLLSEVEVLIKESKEDEEIELHRSYEQALSDIIDIIRKEN